MNRSEKLAAVLSEFARTMLTDFPIQAILDQLVERIVDVLPVTAAGVTLISEDTEPHYIAASDVAALTLVKLQGALGQGPCVTAYELNEPVSVADISLDGRFPDFATSAAEVGVVAVFAFPMRSHDGRVGALDLYCSEAGPLKPWAMSAAQTLADVAAAYLLNARARRRSDEAAEQLRATSLQDPLTGLPNRMMLQLRLDHAAERATRSHLPAAVLFADLDGFKHVNDKYGHFVGDALLIAVGRRLSGLLRPGDTLARVSGDEFVILCEELSGPGVEAVAMRISEAFASPFCLPPPPGGADVPLELRMTASVGIAFAGRADDMGTRLIHDADLAMYQVKRKGGNGHQIIDLTEVALAKEQLELVHDLRAAVESDQLALVYQPIVRATDGVITGVEALLRWTHPTRGPMPALATVAMAEQHALIVELGSWVLRRAMTDRAAWLVNHPDLPLDLAVNVSARQLMEPGLAGVIAGLLTQFGMVPSSLTLEMTENIFLDHNAGATRALAQIKALGAKIALDDFGTGYSSLAYLRQYPVDIVKIDQGFVSDIGVDPTGEAIVEAITGLAHVLGMAVTAEGVETRAQRDEVVRLGCDSAQGHLYARPLTAQDIDRHLDASPTRLHLAAG